jgi:hypothetical protein
MLEKVLGVLHNEATAPTLDSLKSEMAALNLEIDPAAAEEIHNRFAGQPGSDPHRLKTTIEVAMKGVRDQVLNDITQFQLHNRRTDSRAINDWLVASRERYQAWFARL